MADETKVVKTMTEGQFNEKVASKVTHMFKENDPVIVDRIKGIAREQISSPEVLGPVVEATEKALRSWNGKTDAEKALTLAAAQEDPTERKLRQANNLGKMFRGQRIKGGVSDLPMFQTYTAPPRVELGTGELTTRALLHVFRSYDRLGRLDWNQIKGWANEARDEQLVEVIEDAMTNKGFINKELQETNWTEGGAFLPVALTVDFIAYLHGLSAIRALNPVMLNPTTAELRFGRMTSTVTANWVGENQTANASTIADDEVVLTRKELEVKLIQSMRFLDAAPGGVLQMIQDDMRKVVKNAEETALLLSVGGSNEPMGLKYLMNSANRNVDRTQAAAVSTTDEIIGDLLGMQERVYGATAKVIPMRKAYIGQHRTRMGLMAATDADGYPAIFSEMLSRGMLFDAQFGTTTNLSQTQDVDTSGTADHTELFFVEMSEWVLAEWLDMDVREFDQATITDESGNPYNLAERRAKALILCHSIDAALKHDRAACHLKNVDWGSDFLNA